MPAPSVATYSATAKINAHTAFLALIDAGTPPGSIKIRDAADVLLATQLLQNPGGTVNGTTGQLTLAMGAVPNAAASGTAAYAEVCNAAGTVHLSIPAQQGTVAVSGKIVFNTLALVSGQPVEVISAVIG